jgi:hypothetical protein
MQLDAQIHQAKLRKVTVNTFSYLAPLAIYEAEKPYLSRLPRLPGLARTNIAGLNYTVNVHEISGHEELFTLDQSGFEYAEYPIEIKNWTEATAREVYIPKLGSWLKAYFKCSKAHIYAYNVHHVL